MLSCLRGHTANYATPLWTQGEYVLPFPMPDSGMNINVLGGELKPCSLDPVTGFYRTGACQVGPEDVGCHAVCILATKEFLAFSRKVGNDLSTPMPDFGFPGLKPGDRWCLCASRWKEALDAGAAPMVVLEATSMAALDYVSRSVLEEYAVEDVSID